MTRYFAYIRVSDPKQKQGTSLEEQKQAINRHAVQNGLSIVKWYTETETAAKSGRAAFSQMVKALSRKQASGVILHKIDRGARNLRDWADLGELIDLGLDIRFAHENLDLQSRIRQTQMTQTLTMWFAKSGVVTSWTLLTCRKPLRRKTVARNSASSSTTASGM